MKPSLPEWLNKQFLSSCLQGSLPGNPSILVTSYQVQSGVVAAGNNFASNILRVKVEYNLSENYISKESVSLIIKAPVKSTISGILEEVVGSPEINFYRILLPKLLEFTQVPIVPKSYFSPLKSVLIFEDLSESGFVTVNRHDQLDFNHCKQYFISLAKLHASGVALVRQHSEFIEKFPNENEKWMQNKNMIHCMITGLKCLVKSMEALNKNKYKSYIETTKKLIDQDGRILLAESGHAISLHSKLLKSFIHGDCWTTNMMFRYNESGDPVDIRLIDFQVCRYDAIVNDIVSFTWMSAKNEVLENNLEELYSIYCDTLNSTLSELGVNGVAEKLSCKQLMEDILERSIFVLIVFGVFLPFTQSDGVADEAMFFSGASTIDDVMPYYQGQYFGKKFPGIFRIAAKLGVFAFIEKRCSKYLEQNTSK